eukprot:TRINITY_DN6259_c0_g1_i1.p1 TRINITY_DN6259_c0_g1~~TRINITY_DN6259_c0_g1_i1.p1  ORF type:complete len:226 (+),score=25.27 TRINITY_DN6259_c0_g1_i1:61-738(+)
MQMRQPQVAGYSYPDTVHFDTQHEIAGHPRARLSHVEFVCAQFVNGLVCQWQDGADFIRGDYHCSSAPHHNPHSSKRMLTIPTDHFIAKIEMYRGTWCDSIHVTLSNGATYKFGDSNGGRLQPAFITPPGYEVFALRGGYGGHIHNIAPLYRPRIEPFRPERDVFRRLPTGTRKLIRTLLMCIACDPRTGALRYPQSSIAVLPLDVVLVIVTWLVDALVPSPLPM